MESEGIVIGDDTLPLEPIDPKRDRFLCCILWSPLPVITCLIPLVGHIRICREDGVILDFAGPNFVCVDHFASGATTPLHTAINISTACHQACLVSLLIAAMNMEGLMRSRTMLSKGALKNFSTIAAGKT